MIPKDAPKVNENKNIKNVIAVMSGKGGVGKSTITTLLAKELKRKGYSVGVLDADITGPSIPRLMNISDKEMKTDSKNMYPVVNEDGIEVVSMIVTKAIKMARKMNIPILGLIENMSYISCDCCDNKIYLTDENDIQEFLEENEIELLGELPMTKQIASLTKGKTLYPKEIFSKIVNKIINKM